jgi:D-alanyl-D-alanine carboxypeptidase
MRSALCLVVLLTGAAPACWAASPQDLVRAYPDALAGVEGGTLVWRDGTRMAIGDGLPIRTEDEALRNASIADQLRLPYPVGAPVRQDPTDDPGRMRNKAFFDKMYGDCHAGEVTPKLAHIAWLPKSLGRTVTITSVNGVDRALTAVSRELDELPDEDKADLYPLGGTYACRGVADEGQISMHAYGAAIDINTKFSDYWLWRRGAGYRNRIPAAIVAAFERHGFIWGGRWAHYDTMHFEYRPELTGYVPKDAE